MERLRAGGEPPRQRARKACDRCHSSRLKCNAGQPCTRCEAASQPCSYSRPNLRRGRIPLANIRPRTVVSDSQVVDTDGIQGLLHSDIGAAQSASGCSPLPLPPQSPAMADAPMTSIMFPAWLMDEWSENLPMLSPGDAADIAQISSENCFTARDDASTILPANGPTLSQSSANTESSLRYPILRCLINNLQPDISPALACDLLDSYFADFTDGSCTPASGLLLGHLFKRSSFTSLTACRPSSPALLSSMLLVAAATTEAPFFGASPTARSRLIDRLFKLTLRLVQDSPRPHTNATPQSGRRPTSTNKSRCRFVDEVVTYMHLALTSMTVEIVSFASQWWHTAFQLAKEYRLNADVVVRDAHSRPKMDFPGLFTQYSGEAHNSLPYEKPSPIDSAIDVRDNVVIDRDDYRFVHASDEELEERRRVWWTLYIWDKQFALSRNAPAALTNLESREALVPIDEKLWQNESELHNQDRTDPSLGSDYHTLREMGEWGHSSEVFDFFLPFSRILEAIIDQHRFSMQTPSTVVSMERKGSGGNIRRDLSDLARRFDNSDSPNTGQTPTNRILAVYRKFLVRMLVSLNTASWDMLNTTTSINRDDSTTRESYIQASSDVVSTADALQQMLELDPELNLNPAFCDVFLFLGSAIAYNALTCLSEKSSPQLIRAGETFVRALESIISTTRMEHQRKVRRVLLMALTTAKGLKTPSRVDNTLRQHIVYTYRWSIGGAGLAV